MKQRQINMNDFDTVLNRLVHHLLEQGVVFRSGWLTTSLSSKYLNLSQSYLHILRGKGKGPLYHKRGRIYLYKKEDLDRWVEGDTE